MGMGVVPDISNMGLGGKYDTYMHFFYTAATSGDFSPGGQCRLTIATLQLFRRENLVLTRRAIATKKCFVCSD